MTRRVLGLGFIVFTSLMVMGVWLVVQPQIAAPVIPLTPIESADFEIITPENATSVHQIHKIEQGDFITQEGQIWPHRIFSMAYSPDSKTIAASLGTEARLWDVKTGQLIRTYENQHSAVDTLLFSPDGRWLVNYAMHDIRDIWNVQTGERLPIFLYDENDYDRYPPPPDFETFLYSGELVVESWRDDALEIWNLETLTYRKIFTPMSVYETRLTADGRHIYLNDELWSLETWQPVGTPSGIL